MQATSVEPGPKKFPPVKCLPSRIIGKVQEAEVGEDLLAKLQESYLIFYLTGVLIAGFSEKLLPLPRCVPK